MNEIPDLDETRSYTYHDWLTWEGSWELINGKAYDMSPTPFTNHQFIVGELYFALRNLLQNQNCFVFVAPFDVYFSESEDYSSADHVTKPDLSVICSKDQISKLGCKGAPSLIIEVLSPSTTLKDFNEKFNLYEKYGVQEYWIVDPGNQAIHVCALKNGTYAIQNMYMEQDIVHSTIFEHLQIPLDKLFHL